MTVKKSIVTAICAIVDVVISCLRCLKKKSVDNRTCAATSGAASAAASAATDDITFNATYNAIYDVYTTRTVGRNAIVAALFAATNWMPSNPPFLYPIPSTTHDATDSATGET